MRAISKYFLRLLPLTKSPKKGITILILFFVLVWLHRAWLKNRLAKAKGSLSSSFQNGEATNDTSGGVRIRDKDFDLHMPHCKIRRLDPRDESIREFLGHTPIPDLECGRIPALTQLEDNTLTVRTVVMSKFYPNLTFEHCEYRAFIRDYDSSNPDDNVVYSKESSKFTDVVKTLDEFVYVECFARENITQPFYRNVHSSGVVNADLFLSQNPATHNRLLLTRDNYTLRAGGHNVNGTVNDNSTAKGEGIVSGGVPKFRGIHDLSILMLGIDSTSRLNFIRGLPKTHAYLKSQRPESFLFKGYIKVGDNTFPNIIPLTTGHFVREFPPNFGKDHFFDNYTFIWNHYKRQGYTTMLVEDSPEMAAFNYMRKGFRYPPTDFYYRPFEILAADLHPKHCLYDKHKVRALFEYSSQLLNSFSDHPYFCLTYTTRLTHDYLNDVRYLDDILLNYFGRLFELGNLDNTMLFVFGDHGMRYGDFRKTFIGMMEERLPLLYILPPKWFVEEYPFYMANLQLNTQRIVTPFDFHNTMVSLLELIIDARFKMGTIGDDQIYDEQMEPSRNSTYFRSFSVLDEIPSDRSCESAYIPLHFCPCNVVGTIYELGDNRMVMAAALAIIKRINESLSPYNACLPLELDSVKNVRIFKSNWKDGEIFEEKDLNRLLVPFKNKDSNENSTNTTSEMTDLKELTDVRLLITIVVKPSEGIFEASFLYNSNTSAYDQITGDISRVNKYKEQSLCIEDQEIRKYCYCKEYAESH